MPRAIWKGAISFGLITIPVRLYGATEAQDISFHQVHAADGGRVRYKRVCEKCGQEVPFTEIAKGFESADGRVAILEKSDFDALPLHSAKAVDVVEFVDEESIDPTYFEKTYVLEADGPGGKPYVLLRDALTQTGKSALVKVALRQRESLALIRPRDNVLLMHTMLWPDELRDLSFAEPPTDVTASPAEVKMAEMFIEELQGEFDPTQFTDSYREALDTLVQSKLTGAELPTEEVEEGAGADVVDLVAALKASVAAAKAKREAAAAARASAADQETKAG